MLTKLLVIAGVYSFSIILAVISQRDGQIVEAGGRVRQITQSAFLMDNPLRREDAALRMGRCVGLVRSIARDTSKRTVRRQGLDASYATRLIWACARPAAA